MKQHSKRSKGKIGEEKLEQNSEQFEEIDEDSLQGIVGGDSGDRGEVASATKKNFSWDFKELGATPLATGKRGG
jgi:hypothetical protein